MIIEIGWAAHDSRLSQTLVILFRVRATACVTGPGLRGPGRPQLRLTVSVSG